MFISYKSKNDYLDQNQQAAIFYHCSKNNQEQYLNKFCHELWKIKENYVIYYFNEYETLDASMFAILENMQTIVIVIDEYCLWEELLQIIQYALKHQLKILGIVHDIKQY